MWLSSQIPVFIFLSVVAVVLCLEIPPVTFKGNVSPNSIALEWANVVCWRGRCFYEKEENWLVNKVVAILFLSSKLVFNDRPVLLLDLNDKIKHSLFEAIEQDLNSSPINDKITDLSSGPSFLQIFSDEFHDNNTSLHHSTCIILWKNMWYEFLVRLCSTTGIFYQKKREKYKNLLRPVEPGNHRSTGWWNVVVLHNHSLPSVAVIYLCFCAPC